MIDPYAEVKAHFSNVEGVTVNTGRGAQGLKIGKKMFVMFHKGQLLVQFPPTRVSQLIESGHGLPHDPGTGKPMKNRVIIPDSRKESWIDHCEESRQYMAPEGPGVLGGVVRSPRWPLRPTRF